MDIKNHKYRKWNDNDGGVFDAPEDMVGSSYNASPSREARMSTCELETVFEEADEEASETRSIRSCHEVGGNAFEISNTDIHFSAEDIPQAFSCFSYWESKRRFLICDLQGILNTDRSPPYFELTDPVVHHRDSVKGKTKYGRTDKGPEGIIALFRTHVCSNICRMLKSKTVCTTIDFPGVADTSAEVRAKS